MKVAIGFKFVHSFWLDANNEPMIMRVTKISRGTIYYKPIDGGHSSYCDVESFNKYCKHEIK